MNVLRQHDERFERIQKNARRAQNLALWTTVGAGLLYIGFMVAVAVICWHFVAKFW